MQRMKLARVSRILACLTLLCVVGVSQSDDVLGGEVGVTCGWCNEVELSNGWFHGFFDSQGDQCLWPKPDPGAGETMCSRCGGSSTCHTTLGDSEGRCHIACGGDNFAAVYEAIETGLRTADLASIASLIREQNEKYSVEYVAAGGRIDVVASCDRTSAIATYAVPTDLQEKLKRMLAA